MQEKTDLFDFLFPVEQNPPTNFQPATNNDDVSFSVLSDKSDDSSSVCLLSYSSRTYDDTIERPFKIIREKPDGEL